MTSGRSAPSITSLFITGASSGLGRAMALEWARTGIRIGMIARRENELQKLSHEIIGMGAIPFHYAGDVRDIEFMKSAARSFLSSAGIPDLIIANAGIRGAVSTALESDQGEIMGVNYFGVKNTLLPFLPDLIKRKRGQILVISSLASFLPLPGAGEYCASKSALNAWCGSLRFDLIPHGISLTTVNPGFIKTEMTRNNPYPMPFIMDAREAARIIRKKSAKNPPVINFPRLLTLSLFILSLFPTSFREKLFRHLK
ncbi:MAG: SDR family NAD(P)-dependent oxidoreductase [Leptospirales bacterium]